MAAVEAAATIAVTSMFIRDLLLIEPPARTEQSTDPPSVLARLRRPDMRQIRWREHGDRGDNGAGALCGPWAMGLFAGGAQARGQPWSFGFASFVARVRAGADVQPSLGLLFCYT